MTIFDNLRYDYRPSWSPAGQGNDHPLGLVMFALLYGQFPGALLPPPDST